MNLHKYGGGGYEHLLVNIVPRLKQLGASQREVNTLLVDNPREVLSPFEKNYVGEGGDEK